MRFGEAYPKKILIRSRSFFVSKDLNKKLKVFLVGGLSSRIGGVWGSERKRGKRCKFCRIVDMCAKTILVVMFLTHRLYHVHCTVQEIVGMIQVTRIYHREYVM